MDTTATTARPAKGTRFATSSTSTWVVTSVRKDHLGRVWVHATPSFSYDGGSRRGVQAWPLDEWAAKYAYQAPAARDAADQAPTAPTTPAPALLDLIAAVTTTEEPAMPTADALAADLAVTYPRSNADDTPRLHRATCKRLAGSAAPATMVMPVLLAEAVAATCCKPRPQVVEAVTAWAAGRVGRPVTAPTACAIPALTEAEDGRGELAGGDVQALPRTARPRPRSSSRHDQRTPLPTRGDVDTRRTTVVMDAATGAVVGGTVSAAAAPVDGTQTCTGACGQTLPLVKFPTVKRAAGIARGTECRGCRDARLAARRG